MKRISLIPGEVGLDLNCTKNLGKVRESTTINPNLIY
jgi:hypothetical protein